jgi:hypothetical protein
VLTGIIVSDVSKDYCVVIFSIKNPRNPVMLNPE